MWVSRHPMSRWGEAPQAVLWGEQHAPERGREQEGSLQEAVLDCVVPWSIHLKRGSSYGEGVPCPPLPTRTAHTFCSHEAKQEPYPLSFSKGEKADAGEPVYPVSCWGAAESGRDGRKPLPTGRRRSPES